MNVLWKGMADGHVSQVVSVSTNEQEEGHDFTSISLEQ
jgi:hypothetical protein